MARPSLLDVEQVRARLAAHPAWNLMEGAIERSLRFEDFAHAFAFLSAGALAAERLDHHPDWRNVWNRVEIRLSTHDPKGLTELDFALAAEFDRLAAAFGAG